MARERFSAQPHYVAMVETGEVLDVRFVSGTATIPEGQKPFDFGGEQLQLKFPARPGREWEERLYHPRPWRADKQGYVHGLTLLHGAGRDGETHSGAVELVGVVTRQLDEKVMIRSWLASHTNSRPEPDTSWVCQFDDPTD